jgi:hypothetical protein
MAPHDLVPFGFFTMVIVIVIGVPLVRGLVKRWERKDAAAPTIPSDVTARLERMEAGIEAIAIEVERISEGQRFTTKLLSEREAHALPATSRSAD